VKVLLSVYISVCVVMSVQNERVSSELLDNCQSDHNSTCELVQQPLDAWQQEVMGLSQNLNTAQEVNVTICIGHCDKDVLV